MAFDFDTPLSLRNTHCSKYDGIAKAYGTDHPNMIPMWVADMDFAASPAILNALQAEITRGHLGYFTDPDPVNRTVADWLKSRHGWEIEPSWVRYTHGVISGYGDAIATFSEPGDGVIVFAPVYHAFYRQIEAQGRKVVESRLREVNGRFHMDLDALEASLDGSERIVTLCSPHNPGGRIWSADELRDLAELCGRNDLFLISDEIHMDLVFGDAKHIPTMVAAPEHADRIVVLSAASKAFNIAGLETGFLIAPDASVRKKLDRTILDRESSVNRMGALAIKAAFGESDDWLEALLPYLAENFALFHDGLNQIPGVSVMNMEATYLAWADFTGTGLTDEELAGRLLNDARVVPSKGTAFGTGGSGHLRFNVALPRPMLRTAITRIQAAFADLQ